MTQKLLKILLKNKKNKNQYNTNFDICVSSYKHLKEKSKLLLQKIPDKKCADIFVIIHHSLFLG